MLLKSPELARILPFALYILLLALNEPLAHLLGVYNHNIRLIYGLRVSIVGLILFAYWQYYTELKPPLVLRPHFYSICIIVGILVFILWILPYPNWAQMGADGDGFNPSTNDNKTTDWVLALMRLSGAALIVPVMEELFWRSYLMRWLENPNFSQVSPALISAFPFFASACLFALEHNLWLAGLLAGLAYSWLYCHFRNLWAPIIAHALTNTLLGCWVLYTAQWSYW